MMNPRKATVHRLSDESRNKFSSIGSRSIYEDGGLLKVKYKGRWWVIEREDGIGYVLAYQGQSPSVRKNPALKVLATANGKNPPVGRMIPVTGVRINRDGTIDVMGSGKSKPNPKKRKPAKKKNRPKVTKKRPANPSVRKSKKTFRKYAKRLGVALPKRLPRKLTYSTKKRPANPGVLMEDNNNTIEQIVNTAVSQFHGFTAKTIRRGLIEVRNGQGLPIGTVSTDGIITPKYAGQKVLMGSPVRIAIKTALRAR